MALEIVATGRAVPEKRVSNDDLTAIMDTSDEWIHSHTGISNRHIADEAIAASDLAYEAALAALKNLADYDPQLGGSVEAAAASLDLIVVATASGDFISFPSVACLVQHKLMASKAGALDVLAGCTGFIYGLETAGGFLLMDEKRQRCLVIGTEVLSRITNWSDRASAVLFGDGAGAVVLEKTAAPRRGPLKRGILRSILGAEGSGWDKLIIKRGGSRYPYKAGETIDSPPHIEMHGQAVYNFAVRTMTGIIEHLLAEEGLGTGDIDLIVPHQANARIVQAAAKRLELPETKFYLNIDEYANTSAASIPIALDELVRAGRLKRGDLILTAGFGAGLTYGGNLIVW